jgi:hypothetical protein
MNLQLPGISWQFPGDLLDLGVGAVDSVPGALAEVQADVPAAGNHAAKRREDHGVNQGLRHGESQTRKRISLHRSLELALDFTFLSLSLDSVFTFFCRIFFFHYVDHVTTFPLLFLLSILVSSSSFHAPISISVLLGEKTN